MHLSCIAAEIFSTCIIFGEKIKYIPRNHVVIDLDAFSAAHPAYNPGIIGPNADGIVVALFQLPKSHTASSRKETLEFIREKVNALQV